MPEFNKETTESNYDYLKLYASVKTNQCPDIGSNELSNLYSEQKVDIDNTPSHECKRDIADLESISLKEDMYAEINENARPNLNQAYQETEKHLGVSHTFITPRTYKTFLMLIFQLNK